VSLDRIAKALEELAEIFRPKVAKARGVTKQIQLIEEPVVERIPILGGGEFAVTKSYSDELGKAYPAVDVPLTLAQIRAWAIGEKQSKSNGGAATLWTLGGASKAINRWFAKEQNRAEGVRRQ